MPGATIFSEQAQAARRISTRIRMTGNATVEQAFQNIDVWPRASRERTALTEMGADNFQRAFRISLTLAEARDDLALAAQHYEKACMLQPDRRAVLVDLGRVILKAAGREEAANAALNMASRGGETRAAEMARELLPVRYPYVSEFRRALEFDSKNVELRRELGFLFVADESLQRGRARTSRPG